MHVPGHWKTTQSNPGLCAARTATSDTSPVSGAADVDPPPLLGAHAEFGVLAGSVDRVCVAVVGGGGAPIVVVGAVVRVGTAVAEGVARAAVGVGGERTHPLGPPASAAA